MAQKSVRADLYKGLNAHGHTFYPPKNDCVLYHCRRRGSSLFTRSPTTLYTSPKTSLFEVHDPAGKGGKAGLREEEVVFRVKGGFGEVGVWEKGEVVCVRNGRES